MANNNSRADIGQQLLSPYANIDANYGPWSNEQEYQSFLTRKGISSPNPGTLIAIHNQTTGEVTLKIYSKGEWVDVCSGNHDDEGDDSGEDPVIPDPPDPPDDPEPEPVVKTASFTATLDANKYTQAKVGDTITYGVNLVNTGNVGITGGKIISTIKNTSNLSFALEAGHNTRLTYDYTVTQADVDNGIIHNEITVSANSAESGVTNPANVTTSKDITAIAASPSLTITKSANAPFTITTGTSIPYTITVKNTGNVTLASGVVADSKFVIPNNTFTSLVPGISKSYAYTYTVTQDDVNAGKIENTATASNIIAARGVNPTAVIASKTLIIPGPVTPIEPIFPTDIPIGNIHAIDLNLRSGTKWANMNVGAVDRADIGRYFAWGELQPKSSYSWSNYKYCNGTKNTITKYCTDASIWTGSGEPDGLVTLQAMDDIVKQLWGPEWKMPTDAQLAELLDTPNEFTYVQYNDKKVYGVMIYKRGTSGEPLFLPITGTIRNDKIYNDQDMTNSIGNGVTYPCGFYWGNKIRELIDKNNVSSYYCDKVDSLVIHSNPNAPKQAIGDFLGQYRCYGMAIRPVHV